jgi:hypothetical protein
VGIITGGGGGAGGLCGGAAWTHAMAMSISRPIAIRTFTYGFGLMGRSTGSQSSDW